MSAELILITRPAAEAVEYAAALKAEGFATLSEPMLSIRPLDFSIQDIQNYQGIVFTSRNAVRVFSDVISTRQVPVFTVGLQTESLARAAGFTDVRSAEGNAKNLAVLIRSFVAPGGKPLLHPRGVDAAHDLSDILRGDGIQIENFLMYKADKVENFSHSATEALRENRIAAVTFFSRRTAENFMDLARRNALENALKHIKALCLSGEVLECVRPAAWASAHVTETPDRDGMTALIKQECG